MVPVISSTEFLGIHKGDPQPANLGDGKGWVNEMAVIRQDYGNEVRLYSLYYAYMSHLQVVPIRILARSSKLSVEEIISGENTFNICTCSQCVKRRTFRVYQQNGPNANTGAFFLA